MILYAVDKYGNIDEIGVPDFIQNIEEFQKAIQDVYNDFTDNLDIVVLSRYQYDKIQKHNEDEKPF